MISSDSFSDGEQAAGRFQVVVLLYLHAGRRAAFDRYERLVRAIAVEHGGRFESVIQPSSSTGPIALPDEVHVLSFDSAANFEAYRNDPRRLELAPQRAEAVAETIVIEGTALPLF